jgi:hypothetical protein
MEGRKKENKKNIVRIIREDGDRGEEEKRFMNDEDEAIASEK